MKKHPVDDLFKRKLSDLEKKPSISAWSRIEMVQKDSERRLGAWFWYAAAGIIIVMMSGYLVWQQRQTLDQENIAVTYPKSDKVSQDVENSAKKYDLAVDQIQIRKDITLNQTEPEKKNKSGKLPSIAVSASKATKMPVEKVEKQQIQQLASIPVEEVKFNTTKLLPEPVTITVAQSMTALTETKEENRTIVVNVELPEDDKPKSSRFSKVLRQLKNARAGEPVDWNDVGFNPKTIVARVDETIRDNEETISEKYKNIKQRTKL